MTPCPCLPAGVPPLSDLLDSLERSIQSRRKKNVEVLWTAAMVSTGVMGLKLKQIDRLAAQESEGAFFSREGEGQTQETDGSTNHILALKCITSFYTTFGILKNGFLT